jgi:hypothetical protein
MVNEIVEKKQFWKSRIIWINIIGLIAMIVEYQTGVLLNNDIQLAILAVLNMILRFRTDEAIKL